MIDRTILTPYYLDDFLPGLENLLQTDWKLNAPTLPEGDRQERMATLYEDLAGMVEKTIRNKERPVSIAGDCCTTIGVLAGLQRAGLDPYLIWFDAHGDFNTWETTPSGFLGGMPLAMLVGRGEQRMPQAVGLRNLPEELVILSDARDLDPGEKVLLSDSNVQHLSEVKDVLEFPLPDGPLYVHFDTDVIDPVDAPAMNYLAPGGPRADELKVVFQHLAKSGRVAAVSLSSWNPELDEGSRTQNVCMEALISLLGSKA
jgi:arginase